MAALQRQIELDPEMLRAFSQLGYTDYNLGNFPEAGVLVKAIALNRTTWTRIWPWDAPDHKGDRQSAMAYYEGVGVAAGQCGCDLLRGAIALLDGHLQDGWTTCGTRSRRTADDAKAITPSP